MAPQMFLLLCIAVTVGAVLDLEKRIIGGKVCDKGDRLYHVSLLDKNKNFICGGSLISNQWILSAAHCAKDGKTVYAALNVHPDPAKREEVPIIKQVFYKDKSKKRHDLVLLQHGVPKTTNIKHIGFPDCKNEPKIGEKVQIAGHAATTMGPNGERLYVKSDTLQCVDIDKVDCEELRRLNPDRLYQHWFCGQTPAMDACHGDSGGGAVYKGQIYGVISFTGDADYACSKALGIMNICAPEYVAWIKETIDKKKRLP